MVIRSLSKELFIFDKFKKMHYAKSHYREPHLWACGNLFVTPYQMLCLCKYLIAACHFILITNLPPDWLTVRSTSLIL